MERQGFGFLGEDRRLSAFTHRRFRATMKEKRKGETPYGQLYYGPGRGHHQQPLHFI